MDELTPEEIAKEHLDAIKYHIEQGYLSRKGIEYMKSEMTSHFNKIIPIEDSKEYLDFNQGTEAYSKILDTGITAQEALEYVAQCYGKDLDWVNEVKNNNYLHARKVVKHHEDHKIQKEMKYNGTLRVKALNSSTTPNQQLRELHSQRKLHSTLTELIKDNKELDAKVEGLEVKSVINEVNVDNVMSVLSIDKMSLQEKAGILKNKGFNQTKIADYLGISKDTVRRWWKTI